MKLPNYLKYLIIILISIIIALFLIRLFSSRELDDVSPMIKCDKELLEKSDVLWVIPLYENFSIAEDKKWCDEILSLNKTLDLHGIYHTYKELDYPRSKEYIESGITAFKECFGFKPQIFKPSHLAISQQNKLLIEEEGMALKVKLNQVLHKVYHCGDSGVFSNKFIDFF